MIRQPTTKGGDGYDWESLRSHRIERKGDKESEVSQSSESPQVGQTDPPSLAVADATGAP